MKALLHKYHNWLMEIPENTGEIIASAVYLTFMISLIGGTAALTSQAYIPMYFCYGIAAIILGLVYIA